MAIKTIHVHPRFNIGDEWYDTDSGYAEKVKLASKPYYHVVPGTKWGYWKIDLIEIWEGKEIKRCRGLGDMGVKGFNYDDRPCKLQRTLEQAKQTIKSFNEWSMNRDHHF